MQCYANLYHKRFQFFKSYTPFIQCLTENNGRYARCFQLPNILSTAHSSTGYKVKVGCASSISLYRDMEGPCSIPSQLMSVQMTLRMPFPT